MKKMLIFISVSLLVLMQEAQAQYGKYIIRLKDKNNTPYSFNNPSAFLSAKAIARRDRQQISIDSTDLPVNPAYLDSIRSAGSVAILNVSKWLNQVLIQTSDADALDRIQHLSFVKTLKGIAPRISRREGDADDKLIKGNPPSKKASGAPGTGDYLSYGSTYNQISIHEGEFLHNKGFLGEGVTIAVLDGGFYHYDTNPAFDSIRLHNQVLGTWDFVANKESVTEEHYHGMLCLSTIAANRPGTMVGTAPHASFYLFRTENTATEFPVEEQNWVAAAERADSLGVDLITTSLGYSTFDYPSLDYSYEDMDGKTTICARGAEWATKKGMIVTASAGNSGNDSWHYINTPADAEHVIAVGSVDYNGDPSFFSSYGPASDGRVKPDVASVGSNTVVAGTDGNPTSAYSGTSLANPNLAGLIACLWQAFPECTSLDIREAIQKSSDRYTNPDNRTGYGIPNMHVAYNLLLQKRNEQNTRRILAGDWIKAYPVPFANTFNIVLNPPQTSRSTFVLYNAAGNRVLIKYADVQSGIYQQISFSDLSPVASGVYWLTYHDGKNSRVLKLVKQ
jgi:hypothetical protein